MKQLLSFCKHFGKATILVLLVFIISSGLKAQNRITNPNEFSSRYKDLTQNNNSFDNLKTAATATCPTNPVTLVCQDSTNIVNGTSTTIANSATLACNYQSLVLYSNGGTTTNENTPCVSTLYSTYYTNIRNNITETFYEGGANIGCVGPTGSGCSFPIGGTPNTGINGITSWSVLLGYLDPSQQHDFSFCRGAGTITTTSVSLIDCWTGAVLAGPQQLSTATTAPCFTMTLPAGTNIGTTAWAIAPASASPALINYGDGEAQILTYMLAAGTYTVTYSFTPPPSSGCGTVTGTYKFTVGPNPTVAVTSPTACSGNTPTLTASGTSTSYSWSPATGLSATTGSSVTYTGSSSTTYTVTGIKGGCSATATSTVTINPTPTVTVNSASVCAGGTATLTANGATTYSWTPSTGLSATTGSVVTANPATTTVYTVTGTSSSCTSTAVSTVSVTPNPTVTVNSATLCTGGTATLTASGASNYTWTPATNLNTTSGPTVQANPPSTTVYTVTGSIGACSAAPVSSTVTINPTPTVTVNSDVICAGATTTLTANGAITYSWTPSTGLSAITGSVVIANPTTTTIYTVTGTSTGCSSTAISTVSVTPGATITATSATICPGGTGTLTASGASTYTWTPVTGLSPTTGATVLANPASTTVYTVTGSVGSCAAITGTATLTVSSIGSLIVSHDTSICPGASATLTVSGATTYSWSPSTGLSATTGSMVTANPSTSTSYSITGTSGACTSQGVINVTVNPTPTITVNSGSICLGDSVKLKATGATIYSWALSAGLNTTVGDSVMASPSATSIYTVTGTALGCSSTATATVTIISSPSIAITANPNSVCIGGSSTLTATGATTYTWTTDPTLSTSTGSVVVATPTLNPTNYTVSGSVGTCSATPAVITISITPSATLTVSNDTTICLGGTVNLIASGATSYAWVNSLGTPIAASASVAVTPTITQTYYAVGNPASCPVVDSVKVTVNATPTVTASSNPTAICAGQQTATLTATGATTYTWSPATDLSASTGSIVTTNNTLVTSTNYTVTGTDGNGCVGTGNVNLTVNTPPVISVASASICIGNTTPLTASGAVNYSWTPSATLSSSTGTSVTANPTVTTIYAIGGIDANGCIGGTTTTVTVNNLPTVTATSGTTCVGSPTPLTASGANTYTWSPATGLSSPNGSPVNATPSSSGTIVYTISGTDGNGCINTTTANVIANPKPIVSASVDKPIICPGDVVNLTVTGANNYTWTPSATLTNANTANPTGTPSTTINYTVIGTNTVTGCSNSATVLVTISTVTASISADPTIGEAPLTVDFTNNSTGATTYTWNYGNGSSNQVTTTAAGTQTIYQTAGTYTVTMTAANATCQNVTSVIIIVNEGYSISIPNIFTPNGDGINDNFFVKSSGVSAMSILIFDRWGLKMWEASSATSMWDGRNGSKDANDGTYFYIIKATDNKGVSTDYKGDVTLVK